MNKIYKLVWSKSRNMYVAACEFAKSHTKSSRSRTVKGVLSAGLLATVLSSSFISPVYANDTYKTLPAFGNSDWSVTIFENFNDSANGTGQMGKLYYRASDGHIFFVDNRFSDGENPYNDSTYHDLGLATDVFGGSSGGTSGLTGINAGDGISVTTSGTTATVVAKAGTGITVDTNGISITAGSVASGNENAITGGTAYTELRPSENGNYVKS